MIMEVVDVNLKLVQGYHIKPSELGVGQITYRIDAYSRESLSSLKALRYIGGSYRRLPIEGGGQILVSCRSGLGVAFYPDGTMKLADPYTLFDRWLKAGNNRESSTKWSPSEDDQYGPWVEDPEWIAEGTHDLRYKLNGVIVTKLFFHPGEKFNRTLMLNGNTKFVGYLGDLTSAEVQKLSQKLELTASSTDPDTFINQDNSIRVEYDESDNTILIGRCN